MSNLNNYVNYFRSLAVSCVAIGHDAASETGDSVPGAQKFARWNAEEVLTGLRSKVGFPCMLIELYDTALEGTTIYDIKNKPKGAFTILQHVQPNNFIDEQAAFALTEEIINDLLKQIWQHHYGTDADRCVTPFRQFYFNASDITPVGPLWDGCKFGYRVEFGFEQQKEIDFTIAPAVGKFTT